METLMEQKLTREQAMMVIEYFSQQAAEDAPDSFQGEEDWDKHEWLTRYTVSLAIGRQITEHDWHTLLANMVESQSFDRDAEGWLNERGLAVAQYNVDYYKDVLEDLVTWSITNVYTNSAA
jgi:hypothetical protein